MSEAMRRIPVDQPLTISAPIFGSEGRDHFPAVLDAVRNAIHDGIASKAVIFTGDGVAAVELAGAIADIGGKAIAVSFPFGRKFRHQDRDVAAGIVDPSVREQLDQLGVQIVQGFPPFWEIGIPGLPDLKTTVIRETLSLFGGGTILCLQGILMACDEGQVDPGETVIGVAADTALIATAASTEYLFHPTAGVEIRAYIAKPGYFTVTKAGKYQTDEGEDEEEDFDAE